MEPVWKRSHKSPLDGYPRRRHELPLIENFKCVP